MPENWGVARSPFLLTSAQIARILGAHFSNAEPAGGIPMVKWNEQRHLLEHQHHTRFKLVDVDEPNLMRDLFPYTEVCKIDFDHKVLFPDPPEDMFITDTTFRDGQQSRPPYTPEQIATLFTFMHRLGGPNGLIRQTEFFLYSDMDRRGLVLCQELGYRFPEITAWIRASAKDLKLVTKMGLKETGMLTSVSDYHIFLKMKLNRRRAMDEYLAVVRETLAAGIIPRCHFEDITRADIYGFCIPFAIELMELSAEARMPIKIRLCDTMGYGVPYTGAALPRSVQKLVRAFRDDANVPGAWLEWHGHNDFHKVLVNTGTAWLHGCAGANGTLLGYGERTGNAPLEALIIEYISLRGHTNGSDPTVITDIRNFFEHELGAKIPANYPFVGRDFNVTRAGIHVDGIIKNEEIYNIFDTGRILKRPIGVMITDKSGLAGIAHWVNSALALTDDRRVDKKHPGVAKIHGWVMKQYEAGRNTTISDEELQAQSARYLPSLFVSEFDRLKGKVLRDVTELVVGLIGRPEFKTMSRARMEDSLQHFLDDNPFVQFAYVVDMEGKKVTHNVTQLADKAQFKILEQGSFSDRDWFTRPLRDGKVYVTDFYTSKITGKLCITASSPIWDKKGGIVGILGLDFRFEDLARLEDVR
jgi:isopropylmalate/homocitrate/citramalate synthase